MHGCLHSVLVAYEDDGGDSEDVEEVDEGEANEECCGFFPGFSFCYVSYEDGEDGEADEGVYACTGDVDGEGEGWAVGCLEGDDWCSVLFS